MSKAPRKRLSSEWRRARSRVAARSRREREGQLFRQLALELPVAPGLASRLDKASVLRLSLTYLRLRALQENTGPPQGNADPSLCKRSWKGHGPDQCGNDSAVESCVEKILESALGGFLLLVSHSGQIIYTTDGVHTHTGINQMDLIGQNLFHFMHPCDLKEVRDILSSKSGTEDQKQCDLHLRIKCTSSSHGRPASLKSTSWKVLHCTGIRKRPAGSGSLVLLCKSLLEPPISVRDASLDGAAFLSRHTPDMCFSYCQPRVSELIGYTENELIGESVYQYYHALDCKNMLRTHLSLLSKGRVSTGLYRLLVKRGGFVWMETSATVVYNSRTGHPQSVICVNYVLSDVEQPDVVLSLKQKELLTPRSSVPITAPSLVHQAAGSASCSGFTVEKSIPPSLHDVRKRMEVQQTDPFIETLLEWDSTENTEKATQDLSEEDLDTLAPYIPMDGEDFPLSPISNMVEDLTETRPQESLFFFPDNEMESCGWSDCPSPSPGPSLHRPLTPYAPSQKQPPVVSHYSSLWTHMLKGSPYWDGVRSAYSNDIVYTSSCEKQEVHTRKRHWTDGHFLSSRDQQSCCNSCTAGQLAASQWKKFKPNYSNYMPVNMCDPLWWNPGAMINGCYQIPLGFVPWAPQYRNTPSSPPALADSQTGNDHRAADQPRAELAAAVLPVLSRLECEVNAPLGPTSYLLHGAEIVSFLDQATFRLCP